MRKPPHTEKRKGQWYYRLRVSPAALIPIIGFGEYRESLRTTDIEVARVRAAIRHVEVTVELQAAKAQLKQQQSSTDKTQQVPLKLTPEALAAISDAVKAHVLQIDEDFRRSEPDEDMVTPTRCP